VRWFDSGRGHSLARAAAAAWNERRSHTFRRNAEATFGDLTGTLRTWYRNFPSGLAAGTYTLTTRTYFPCSASRWASLDCKQPTEPLLLATYSVTLMVVPVP
jgi:hypothetical protein